MKKFILPVLVFIALRSFAQTEPDPEGKIKMFFAATTDCFSSLKDSLLRAEGSTKHFNTRTTFFGKKGEVEDAQYDCSLRYSIAAYLQEDGLGKANKIYNQLKTLLQKILAGKIEFDHEKQTSYDKDSYIIEGRDPGKNLLDTKNIISLTIKRDKDWPAVYLTIQRKKY